MQEILNDEIPENITILVVDDDAVTRMILQETLSRKYQVLIAENGLQAWDIVSSKAGEIDVVLTDMHMPELDGMGLLTRIRENHPHICVIVLSGSSDISQAVTAIRKGAHDYIVKPFANPDELEIILWRWFHQQSLESKLSQYARLHQEMMHNMKSRSFLAVDVAQSRELKKDEDPFLVQYSFTAYHDHIAEIIEQHDGRVHSTAGDGIMSCFNLATNAMAAAKKILVDLDGFNAQRNQLGRDFRLRLGIHTGSVIVERNGRINEMFSETLDIAGHIQKQAAINSINLSEVVREHLANTADLTLQEAQIDGLQIYSYYKP